MNEDIYSAVKKSEKEEKEIVSSAIQKMNESGQRKNFDVSQRSRVLPGTIIPARVSNGMRKHQGTFGRYSKQ